ncbi:MAG: glycosyltransferase 2 family protein [Patescibacteria group bacterium]|nr:glycosyltransferase 2 family protein [Patescibacteria group bacterium]
MDYKKYFKLILRFAISGGLIVFLIWRQDFTEIIEILAKYNPAYIVIGLTISLTSIFVASKRWKTILNVINHDAPHKSLYILCMKGYFYNNFLPTQMGGDLYKSVALGRRINDQATSLFSVFIDRFGGLVILLLLSLFGIASTKGYLAVLVSLAIVFVGLLLYFPVLNLLSKKITFLVKFKEASELFIKNKKGAGLILLYSLMVQMFSFTMVYVLFIGLGVTLPFWAVIAYMPLTSLALLIPSFNGFGTQELVYAGLYSTVGVTPEISIAASLLVHIIRLLMSLIGGVLILLGKE